MSQGTKPPKPYVLGTAKPELVVDESIRSKQIELVDVNWRVVMDAPLGEPCWAMPAGERMMMATTHGWVGFLPTEIVEEVLAFARKALGCRGEIVGLSMGGVSIVLIGIDPATDAGAVNDQQA